jgi:ParB/RepB/Spo0J family partition protein
VQFKSLEVSRIREPQNCLRLAIDDYKLDELCASIRDIGLQMPILVKPITGDTANDWEVVDGHRRYLAVVRLGFETVNCAIIEREQVCEAAKLACNLMREDNNDAEIANWLAELADKHEYGIEQLCALVNRSENWVNDRVALLRGYQFVFEALAARTINMAQAKAINRCKDESWAKMGLHYAVVDNLPATRLTEYFVRNCPEVTPPMQARADAVAAVEVAQETGPGIVCAICGGYRDPVNMMNIWVHRWHWEQIVKILEPVTE